MDRGVWWAAVHRVAESDMTEQLGMHSVTLGLAHSRCSVNILLTP